MVRYRRNFVPGGTWFFTATLADRRSTALVDHIDALRSAFRAARRASHFAIDAIVVLPDHLRRTIGQATSATAEQISESRARRRSPHERSDVRARYASKPPRISLRSSGLRLLAT